MGFRYEVPPEKGHQMAIDVDDDGFAYIKEDSVGDDEVTDESKKEEEESRVVGFNKGTEVWVEKERDFRGFLQNDVDAIKIKKVEGGASVYRFYENVGDPEKVGEVDVYIDGKSVTMKSQDFFRAYKSNSRASKKR